MLNNTLKVIFKELGKADNFRYDWYGYATNQMAHGLFGFLFACFISYGGFLLYGEFCEKQSILLTIFCIYALVEFLQINQKNIWDIVEDTIFFVGYGAGTAILLFSEVEVGSTTVVTDLKTAIYIATLIAVHLSTGILCRAYSKSKRGKND